ncbi:hypothetical protein VTL71DRAFT_8640 [Oculimacula yallundae]|uniref:Fungal lipase-type domain-containing protein n=1 Tax=Oculimacula yallundae TaxID=86028 RepID=A0ABR4CYB8_9HELO
MFTTSKLVLALAALIGSAVSTPIVLQNNGSSLLEERGTPNVLTAPLLGNMKYMAQVAASAYCNSDPKKVGSIVSCGSNACPSMAPNGVINFAYLGFSQAQVVGYVGIDPANKIIVVSYKGTKSLANIIADLLVPKEKCDELAIGCKFHQGFRYAWGDVRMNTERAVQAARAKYPDYGLIITGHSLGGAVATIAAAYLRQLGYPCDVYSFGSPRVGNQVFADYFNWQAGAHYRVTHTDDPAPRFPGRGLKFYHTGTEFWLSTGGAKTINYDIPDIKVCPGTQNGDCNASTGNILFSAHSYYFQHITACG